MKNIGRLSFDNILSALREAGGRLECGCPSGRENMSEEQLLEHDREARQRCEQKRIEAATERERERAARFQEFVDGATARLCLGAERP